MPQDTTKPPFKPQAKQPPTAMMMQLSDAGFQILPVGRAGDPKAAAIGYKGRDLNAQQAVAICHKNGSGAYGVRLDDMVVVDYDCWDTFQMDYLATKFGKPEVTVGTHRGLHAYYAQPRGWDHRGAAQVITDTGIKADLKWGAAQYVIGPQSCRADGASYHPIKGELPRSGLAPINPITEINPDKLAGSERVLKGKRHDAMKRLCLETVWACDTAQELFDNLRMEADLNFEDGKQMPVNEMASLARWTWGKMISGELNPPHAPAFDLRRDAMTLIGSHDDALALYVRLVSSHGLNGRVFLLNRDGMYREEVTRLSRRRFNNARDYLISVGLLKITSEYVYTKKLAREYRLPIPPIPRGRGAYTDWLTSSGTPERLH